MGALYQLRSKRSLQKGQDVAVNGPWDKYGYIIKPISETEDGTLFLIRGTGNTPRQGEKDDLHQF